MLSCGSFFFSNDFLVLMDMSEQTSEVIDGIYLRMFRRSMGKTGLFQP